MNAIQNKLEEMTSGELFDVLKALVFDEREEADLIYTYALNAIEKKVSEESTCCQ